MTIQKPTTLQEAKSIARHLRLTLRKVRSGHYRVNFRDGNETTAYYTDNLEDAVKTAVEMARKRASSADVAKRPCGHLRDGPSHDQIRETLFTLWWKVRPYLLPPGPALLPQSLQRQLHCKGREELCAPEKVAWLLPRLGA